jgi:hypothetical protein
VAHAWGLTDPVKDAVAYQKRKKASNASHGQNAPDFEGPVGSVMGEHTYSEQEETIKTIHKPVRVRAVANTDCAVDELLVTRSVPSCPRSNRTTAKVVIARIEPATRCRV